VSCDSRTDNTRVIILLYALNVVYLCLNCNRPELWWLEGHYHDRNKDTDTRAKCRGITQKLREGIQDESIVASYVRQVGHVPVMFVHAGYRRDMIEFMKKKYSIEGTAEELSAVTNKALRDVVTSQAKVSYIAPSRTSFIVYLLLVLEQTHCVVIHPSCMYVVTTSSLWSNNYVVNTSRHTTTTRHVY
jgi:hypothetical protein